MRVYIAGPITTLRRLGMSWEDIGKEFERAAGIVRNQGHTPVLPPGLVGTTESFEMTWVVCMKKDLTALMSCEGIFLMNGWSQSEGVRLELLNALALKLFVLTEGMGG